ncbi:MAG TPA: glycosyltransferase family 1 protein [bacterium]|nr:glycosyltransferase family 1 protein [bacterium]
MPPGHMVVLAIGRMVYVKGFNFLLEAFQRIACERKDVTLVLAGDGVIYKDLKELTDKLGIRDRVIMPGAVMRQDVPIYFKMADIYVVPSIRHESGAVDGLPVVVPEAMAAGLPVIASDLSGIPVLIKDGYNGKLVKERDVEGIADALICLIDDQKLRQQYGERSLRIIKESVNYDTVSDHFSSLYKEIVLHKKPVEEIPAFTIPLD